MVSRMLASKIIFPLVPGTWECVTLHDKRYPADVNKLQTLRWRVYSGLSGWAQCNQSQGSLGMREGGGAVKEEAVTTETCRSNAT